jgi:adenine-specific DNA-methyltransferase
MVTAPTRIKYLGSKRLLVGRIVQVVGAPPEAGAVALDLFSGTARVGAALKEAGWRVVSGDTSSYAHTFALCYVQADRSRVAREASDVIEQMRAVRPSAGYVTETFCRRSRFFTPENGEKIDAAREMVARLRLDPEVEAVALTSLIEAADRVDSTVGLQMAYLKQWAPRALNPLDLRMPELTESRPGAGKSTAVLGDAASVARAHPGAHVAYLDPPYNQHSYLGNYHVWESIVRWDKPDVYGVACKRVDVRERQSPFNRRTEHAAALADVLLRCSAGRIILSYSDDGFLPPYRILQLLRQHGIVEDCPVEIARHVGAQIGQHNRAGVRIADPSPRTRVREHLYSVRRDILQHEGAAPP